MPLSDGSILSGGASKPELVKPKLDSVEPEEEVQALPAEFMKVANRPDIPYVDFPPAFVLVRGETVTLSTELDRWKLLSNDPRFSPLLARWRLSQASDAETMDSLKMEIYANLLFLELAEKQRKNELTDEEIRGLYRIDHPNKGPDLPVLETVRSDIQTVSKERRLDSSGMLNCYRRATSIFADIAEKQQSWVKEGVSQSEFVSRTDRISKDAQSRYQIALTECGKN
jgi:hypothetical protein